MFNAWSRLLGCERRCERWRRAITELRRFVAALQQQIRELQGREP
jgi:hypothetical protein